MVLELLDFIRKVHPYPLTCMGRIPVSLSLSKKKGKPLSTGLCHLMHFCEQENLKSLVVYVVESFWDQLLMFEQLTSIQAFKLKYQQVDHLVHRCILF